MCILQFPLRPGILQFQFAARGLCRYKAQHLSGCWLCFLLNCCLIQGYLAHLWDVGFPSQLFLEPQERSRCSGGLAQNVNCVWGTRDAPNEVVEASGGKSFPARLAQTCMGSRARDKPPLHAAGSQFCGSVCLSVCPAWICTGTGSTGALNHHRKPVLVKAAVR